MGNTGFEIPAVCPLETAITLEGGAKNGAKTFAIADSDLADVVAVWATLPPADRAAIMLRVKAATGKPPASEYS